MLGADPDYSELKTAGLTDSQIARMLMERHGVEESPETVGRSCARTRRGCPRVSPSARAACSTACRRSSTTCASGPGVHSLLLTGNTQAGAAAKLAHYGLDGYFENGAFCMDMDDRDAIARRALEIAAATIGESPDLERTFVIGDTAHDIAAGKAIGARTIAIASGVVTAEELERHEPWLVWEGLPGAGGVRAGAGAAGARRRGLAERDESGGCGLRLREVPALDDDRATGRIITADHLA